MRNKIAVAWRFLVETNYAKIDMYFHNYENNNAFFAYRNVDRTGKYQYSPFKGSYEIGAALWGMSLNKSIVASAYLDKMVEQIKKSPLALGFWDHHAQNWIHTLRWRDDRWQNFTPHDWKYSPACQEGALQYMLMGGEGLAEQITSEQTYIETHIGKQRTPYEYGLVLSCLALDGSQDTDEVFQTIVNRWPMPGMDVGYSILLRGMSNASHWDEDVHPIIGQYVSFFMENQQPSGSWFPEDRRIQQHLKRDIGIMTAYQVTKDEAYLDAVEKNLNWILKTHWDEETGGIPWMPNSKEFFECHQMWFMIAAKMLCDARGE